MAPEAIKVFEACRDRLISQALQGKEEQLKVEIGEAVAHKRYSEAQTAIQKLESAENTRNQLTDAFAKVAEVLVSCGLDQIEIPGYQPPQKSPPVSQRAPVSLPGLREKTVSPLRDRKTFVEDSLAQAMRAIIAQDKNGEMVFETAEQAATAMLQSHLRRHRDMVHRATKTFINGRRETIKKIKAAAAEIHATTIEEVFEPIIPLVKNEKWRAFYREALDLYGELSPEEFINQVLKRQPDGGR